MEKECKKSRDSDELSFSVNKRLTKEIVSNYVQDSNYEVFFTSTAESNFKRKYLIIISSKNHAVYAQVGEDSSNIFPSLNLAVQVRLKRQKYIPEFLYI